ncbi:hypothetical protein [Streptomyces exfoliatus]|uniref:hypothetical protein n=1 Tax=Streptomyces exfoliatus TaxID=1905 RepID=UPI0004B351F6|nr:hypothetical protein [Streptomyces exfoliatus]
MPAQTSVPTAASIPPAVDKAARAFTLAYVQHDARNGGDPSYADAGTRAARFAAGELVDVLAQQRPGQEAPWAALRSEQARQTAMVEAVVVPDGAPGPTESSAIVRVGYVLTTKPASGPSRQSTEQLLLRLGLTSGGWRVIALPWV